MNNNHIKNKALVDMPATGKMIDSYLAEKRIYKSALARSLGIHIKTLIRIRSLSDVSVSWLWVLSHALKHNFIADIAARLPADYTGALQDALAGKDREIARLQDELAVMAKERNIYKELILSK